MTTITIRKSFLAALACILFIAPSLVNAGTWVDRIDDNSVIINFSDLDLSGDQGVETLYGRLRNGARQVCGSVNAKESLQFIRQRNNCFEQALSDAVKGINSSDLTEMHSSS